MIMFALLFASAGTMLECTVSATAAIPDLERDREVAFEVTLQEATVRSMESGAAPVMPIRFAGEMEAERGWLVETGRGTARPLLMLGRVTPHAAAAQPFYIRWGIATRAADAEAWEWQETLRGPCRLATQEDPR